MVLCYPQEEVKALTRAGRRLPLWCSCLKRTIMTSRGTVVFIVSLRLHGHILTRRTVYRGG